MCSLCLCVELRRVQIRLKRLEYPKILRGHIGGERVEILEAAVIHFHQTDVVHQPARRADVVEQLLVVEVRQKLLI